MFKNCTIKNAHFFCFVCFLRAHSLPLATNVMRCYNLYMNEILNEAPFAAKVKYLRAKLMLTQEVLAKELGVSFATVNRWESQCRTPQFLSKEKFFGFCEKMGIIFPDNGTGG